MLRYLSIKNLILIEEALIEFSEGLNIITGETGAGKSAILHSLKLLCGDRYDSTTLRAGTDKGWVEGAFDIDYSEKLAALLQQSGIDYSADEPLLLRRELQSGGKSKCFINNQFAQKSTLQNVATFLVHMVGQNASRSLLQIDAHREILDQFGENDQECKVFAELWLKEKELHKKIIALVSNEQERLRTIDSLQREIEELTAAHLQEGEEEELFAEYSVLSNVETLSQNCQEALILLQAEQKGILPAVTRLKRCLEKLHSLDPSLADLHTIAQNAHVELQEIAYTLNGYQSKLDHNPHRVVEIDDRLSYLSKLKKRYGNDISTMLSYLKEAEYRLQSLENSSNDIEQLQIEASLLHKQVDQAAIELTSKRKSAASVLSEALTQELRALNMPQVEVSIEILPKLRTEDGDDHVEIFIKPNLGEKIVSLRQCASGGEVARVLLALRVLLSSKDEVPTLIFDEIDANIGGQTASLVGKKLRDIGTHQQVICITHFSQVANQAHHHLQITKQEVQGRTLTSIQPLSQEMVQQELARMAGAF